MFQNLPKSSADTTIGKIADIGVFLIVVGGLYVLSFGLVAMFLVAIVCGILESAFGIPTFMSNTY